MSEAVMSQIRHDSPTALDGGAGQAALLDLHRTLRFRDLWTSLQRLCEIVVPHDNLTMSVNYLDWRNESSKCRLSSEKSPLPHDEDRNRALIEGGRSFFQPYLDARPGLKAYRHSEIISDSLRRQETELYRRYMRPNNWAHSAHLLYWQDGMVDTSLALRRRPDQGDFSNREMEILHTLHAHLEVSLDRIRRFEEERQKRRLLESYYSRRPGAVLYLNWKMEPVYSSHDALGLCSELNFGTEVSRGLNPHSNFKMPPSLADACETLRGEWHDHVIQSHDAGKHPRLAKQLSFPVAGIDAEVIIRPERHGTLTKPALEVRMRKMEAETIAAAPRIALPAGGTYDALTPAERTLVELVCEGFSNKEIAGQLHKTEGTIKVQLSGVFRKFRVQSRTQLMAALR
ncbi:LuxR C-terminal-related transcriptional regulator [Luteolibacter flavescens]|uniref:LuxR C-terminal-related transcriptional regulator n=1 Tax=Luteolibacter flavescens TaxID=1859460 RepID=A0ABT3FI92_9BACT|nr:LuxR C-terminal-related transcriptional regulator [Luteolibacter flavescens]MCW1883272.1 LuxR C-terminal-related transcriptional regulator [Luteolibacter flavescens]